MHDSAGRQRSVALIVVETTYAMERSRLTPNLEDSLDAECRPQQMWAKTALGMKPALRARVPSSSWLSWCTPSIAKWTRSSAASAVGLGHAEGAGMGTVDEQRGMIHSSLFLGTGTARLESRHQVEQLVLVLLELVA